jgi:alcohol dehydrogenase class IV
MGVALSALTLLIEHWFPWRKRPGDLARYAMGSGAILAGMAFWLLSDGDWQTFVGVLLFYAVGGGAVILAHGHDRAANLEQKVRFYERGND